MKKIYFLLSLTYFISLFALAQIPNGYYDSAEGLHGQALRAALHDIIDDHNSINYGDIYGILDQTDQKPNGKVWDMYSDVPGGTPPYEFSFGQDECGNYGGEGDCFNKEHSWPKSWFGGKVYPMYSDLFHIVPTDGYVNNRRGNYPYGEVGTITWLSQNGSKVGSNTYPGYTGTVFEPIDEYKGDFARNYFYMSTRYYGEDSGWPGSDAVDGADLKPWTTNMLLEWNNADPVSQKEIDRCNAVFNIQGNRNPFIDHPEYVALVWDPNAAISELQLSDIMNIYTSSNGEQLNIDALEAHLSDSYQIRLYNISGQQIAQEFMQKEHDAMNISQLKKGCYILSLVNTQNNQSYHFKFIK
jgi:endonuclease I